MYGYKPAQEYKCSVEYTSQIADGAKHYVESNDRNCDFNY